MIFLIIWLVGFLFWSFFCMKVFNKAPEIINDNNFSAGKTPEQIKALEWSMTLSLLLFCLLWPLSFLITVLFRILKFPKKI